MHGLFFWDSRWGYIIQATIFAAKPNLCTLFLYSSIIMSYLSNTCLTSSLTHPLHMCIHTHLPHIHTHTPYTHTNPINSHIYPIHAHTHNHPPLITTSGTLRHVLDTPSKYPLKWKQKLQLALDAATGLAYLHRKGHTHGGIKSHTLLAFESQGRLRLKVAELGLARFRVQLDMTQETDRLHRSLAWEPPEAFSTTVAKQPAGDVYSFGMVLFEVATGRVPFADVGAYGTRQAISNGDIPVISKSLPPAYRELYHACCALKVDARPSMVQVVAALEGLLADGPESVQVRSFFFLCVMYRMVGKRMWCSQQGCGVYIPYIHTMKTIYTHHTPPPPYTPPYPPRSPHVEVAPPPLTPSAPSAMPLNQQAACHRYDV